MQTCNDRTAPIVNQVHDTGRLDGLGFKPVSLALIERALADVAPYEHRRAQEGSSTCDPAIAALQTQVNALTADQYVNSFPVPPTPAGP